METWCAKKAIRKPTALNRKVPLRAKKSSNTFLLEQLLSIQKVNKLARHFCLVSDSARKLLVSRL